MRRLIKYSKSMAIILLIFTLAYCTCKTCQQKDEFIISVPDSIFVKGDQFISSKVGDEFFKNNFFRDFVFSKKIGSEYYLRYNYRSLDYDFVDEPVYFWTDSLGNVIPNKEIVGIPNCLYSPELCEYAIDREDAIHIAKDEGLAKGVREWDVSFRWNAELKSYIWHILSTTWEIGSGDNYKAKGEEIMIDPVSGSVLKKREWQIR